MNGIRMVLLGACLATTQVTLADGGAVRASEARGDFRITVFTSPTPLVVGAADVSVLVLDARNGLPVTTPALVLGTPTLRDGSARLDRWTPLTAGANKLMQSATMTLNRPGTWRITVAAEGLGLPLHFDVEVGEPAPPWHEMSLWIGWPLLVIAAFAVRRWAIARRARPPQRGEIP